MAKKLCALSVDLDPLTAYYKIHGLGEAPVQLRYTIMRKALPRFEDLFAEAAVPATFFVVGQEIAYSTEAQEILRRMARAGHELGNHTFTHPYDLCTLPEQVIDEEIRKAHQAIVDVVGIERAPKGFRVPGYTIGDKVLRVLEHHGYRYDSSMFPSLPYYAAKLAVMAGMSLRGRRSGAVVGDVRAQLAPPVPYRPDSRAPWRKGQSPVVELPISTLPWTRLPPIGTFIAVGPERIRRFLLNGMRGRDFFNLELHGIDLADAIADRIPTELAGRQPDLRVPFKDKRRIFLETINSLKAEYEFVTLDSVATVVQREGHI